MMRLKMMNKMSNREMELIEKAFARCFAKADGQIVLDYLHSITYDKPVSIYASDAELRHNEGQKHIVFIINSLIKKGSDRNRL